MPITEASRVEQILAEVKRLAVEYYDLTGKPLGVTGEVAEFVGAKHLDLELAPPRTEGYDAIRKTPTGDHRVQIKGRALAKGANRSQRLGVIKKDAEYDSVLLVLLDNTTLEPLEMHEASRASVVDRLNVPGSKARARGALGVAEFKRIATRVWPAVES